MGMRTGEQGSVEHAGQLYIVDVTRTAGRLIAGLNAGWARSNAHGPASASRSAASTIFT